MVSSGGGAGMGKRSGESCRRVYDGERRAARPGERLYVVRAGRSGGAGRMPTGARRARLKDEAGGGRRGQAPRRRVVDISWAVRESGGRRLRPVAEGAAGSGQAASSGCRKRRPAGAI